MPTSIIAELSTSHGGERAWQEKLIESVAVAGAEFAKFQSYQTKHLDRHDPQYAWLKQAELSDKDHARLVEKCARSGIQFLTTVFHEDRVPFLADLGLPAIKIGSGEAMRPQLLEAVSHYPWTVYASTGLLTVHELDQITDILQDQDLVLLHTVTKYPTLIAEANMTRMRWLSQKVGRPCGYSDHTIGTEAALYALAHDPPAIEVHHAIPSAPRCRPWDKDFLQLRRLCTFRDSVAMLCQKAPMLHQEGDRPYVGRWAL